jgi:hypothetical protein
MTYTRNRRLFYRPLPPRGGLTGSAAGTDSHGRMDQPDKSLNQNG